jgi:hypothetical protein
MALYAAEGIVIAIMDLNESMAALFRRPLRGRTGTLFRAHVFIPGQRQVDDAWRMTMAGMFTSTLWVSGEILLGLSLTLFIGGMIATLGDRARMGRR